MHQRKSSSLDRVTSLLCACDLRSFVLLVGLVIVLANVLLLVQLNPDSHTYEHRPSGGPIQGTDTHGNNRETQGPSIIKSRYDKILALKRTDAPAAAAAGVALNQADVPKAQHAQVTTDQPTTTTPPVAPVIAVDSASALDRVSLWSKPAQTECDRQFGNGFSKSSTFCSRSTSPSSTQSSMDCHHNPLTGGVTCESRRLLVDLTKLFVSHGGEPIESVRGRSEDAEFVRYGRGAFRLECTKAGTQIMKDSYPHHLGDMLGSIEFDTPIPGSAVTFESQCQTWIEEPTLFVTRYEYANMYHSIGDFYNTYQTQWMSGMSSETNLRVIFFDGHSAGALDQVWTKLFGTKVGYVKSLPEEFGSDKMRYCFRRAVLVSPAYKSALSVDMMAGQSGCSGHGCLEDFSQQFLKRYGIEELDPMNVFKKDEPTSRDLFGTEILPSTLDLSVTPLVTMIFRKDYLAHPRLATLQASRKIANEDSIRMALGRVASETRAHVIGVDFAKLNVVQQLLLVRYSSVLVGIHGAGLSYTLFLSSGGSVFELLPPEYAGRPHFRFFALWMKRYYTSMNVGTEIGGQGHMVEPSQFEAELKMIVRMGPTEPRHALVEPTEGWRRAFIQRSQNMHTNAIGTNEIKSMAASPAGSVSSTDADAAMVDDPLPSDPNRAELDPSSDRGEDLGPSGNDGHRLCIVVPFRDSKSLTSQGAGRTANLMQMIPHMIKHLEGTGMRFVRDFEFIIVEQTEGHVFNKGALFNIGYIHSKQAGCDYMVLHDVDQVPTSTLNRYRYPFDGPIHLCSASSQYGYQMAYGTMVGGALLLTMRQFEQVNGYSNFYFGWGQEDDDFYYRLASKFGNVGRLSAEIGRYEALSHPRVKDLDVTPIFTKGTQHLTDTRTGAFDIRLDGISNLKYQLVGVKRWKKRWSRGVRKFVAELKFENMPKDLNGNVN